jgi:hypothetical protein
MHKWMRCAWALLLVGTLFGALSGCGHDPNHDIDMEKARAAANRVHAPPKPGEKMEPGGGG